MQDSVQRILQQFINIDDVNAEDEKDVLLSLNILDLLDLKVYSVVKQRPVVEKLATLILEYIFLKLLPQYLSEEELTKLVQQFPEDFTKWTSEDANRFAEDLDKMLEGKGQSFQELLEDAAYVVKSKLIVEHYNSKLKQLEKNKTEEQDSTKKNALHRVIERYNANLQFARNKQWFSIVENNVGLNN